MSSLVYNRRSPLQSYQESQYFSFSLETTRTITLETPCYIVDPEIFLEDSKNCFGAPPHNPKTPHFIPESNLGSPMKSLGDLMKSLGFPLKIWWVSIENLGVYRYNQVLRWKVWDLRWKVKGLQWKSEVIECKSGCLRWNSGGLR